MPEQPQTSSRSTDDGLIFRFFGAIAARIRPNPYPYYRFVRAIAPVMRIPPKFWLVTTFAEAESVLSDRRFIVPNAREISFLPAPAMEPIWEVTSRILLARNPPDHTRLRGLMSKAFSAPRTGAMRPRIEKVASALLADAGTNGTFELIRDFAYPLPVTVIAEMLGVPVEDQGRFLEWSHELVRVIEPIRDLALAARITNTMREFNAYFSTLIDDRRAQPRDDLISALIAAEESGDRLRSEELVPNLMMLLVAGHETTTNLIGNGVYALMRNRRQWDLLRRDPSLARSAVEELLRFESPVQVVARVASEATVLRGKKLGAGEIVLVMLGAANRDPRRFVNPNALDITRGDRDHLAFGGGIHYCLGANLARLEGEIALAALACTAPDLNLDGAAPVWRDSINLRGLDSLPLRL